MARLPVTAITMGDPAGIGPEIVVKALADPSLREVCRPLAVGDPAILEHHRRSLAPGLKLVRVERLAEQGPGPGEAEVVAAGLLPWTEPILGRATAEGGRAAVEAIERACRLVMEGEADALVTAPINKAAIKMAGSPFPGHTEMLAHLTGAADFAMMLVGGSLRVSLATIHIPLARVPLEIDAARILRIIGLTARAVQSMGIPRPRVAVCGLNPHAGEGGLFGREEQEVIRPAVERAVSEGLDASGPHPADTVFYRAVRGDFDAVVAMYHDQGLGPLKTLYFDEGVNVTLGLPIVRTSVDHGTAYDIAGRGVASPRSLLEAVQLAARMVGRQ